MAVAVIVNLTLLATVELFWGKVMATVGGVVSLPGVGVGVNTGKVGVGVVEAVT